VYDSEELAVAILPDDGISFDIYGYFLYPMVFKSEKPEPLVISGSSRDLSPSFEFLGFDVVSRSLGSTFECSPLSCNHWAEKVPVNEHCLIDELKLAFEVAAAWALGGAEPGPYFVLQVWRRKKIPPNAG
jgi:hypothetical protein